jgi:AcrR family transcriptional regulator
MNQTAPVPATDASAPSIRDQIVEAADAHFSRYGYAKTTMADLARTIGFSKAYLYKFFDSKQAIGEAICTKTLAGQYAAIVASVEAAPGPTEKVRAMLRTAVEQCLAQFFAERQLYDIVAHSRAENWASSVKHIAQLNDLLKEIIREGRASGDFEKKTPLDEVCQGIWLAALPLADPVLLQHNLDLVEDGLPAVTGLILRSLAP